MTSVRQHTFLEPETACISREFVDRQSVIQQSDHYGFEDYIQQIDFRFDMKTFMELRNVQPVTIAYDSLAPTVLLFYNDSPQILFSAGCRWGL